MSGYDVNPDDLRAVAAQMAQANQSINAQMNQLMRQLSALPGLWSGPAATSFHNAKSRWATLADQHNQRLADIAHGLIHTHGDYVRSEHANTDGFNGYLDGINS